MPMLHSERSPLEVNRTLKITGLVQGVGFRPVVYQLADRYSLKGYILNNTQGVSLEIEGEEIVIEDFIESLKYELPPLARIDTLSTKVDELVGYSDFSFDDLETIVKSMAEELKMSGAKIVCGDTKVVPKGAVDQIFINTSGIGEIEKEGISANNLHVDDVIIVSGDVGRHGAAILMEREGVGISGDLKSDCATLWKQPLS